MGTKKKLKKFGDCQKHTFNLSTIIAKIKKYCIVHSSSLQYTVVHSSSLQFTAQEPCCPHKKKFKKKSGHISIVILASFGIIYSVFFRFVPLSALISHFICFSPGSGFFCMKNYYGNIVYST